MQKRPVILSTLGILSAALFLNSAFAGDIEWSGVYRFEGNQINNSELGGAKTSQATGRKLTYGLNHLVLRPKIVAGDGITIFGQFNIFNDATNYPNSQMGQIWGSGVRTGATGATTSADNSNTQSGTQKAEMIEVSQLYMTLNQEYGSLILGRAPLQFGLGITHNAGRGLFDHWYDTRDMVAYKFLFGNMSFLPMVGKSGEGAINQSDDVTDYMIQFMYENPETDVELGVFYQLRKGGDQSSDGPRNAPGAAGSVLGGPGSTNTSPVDIKTVNLFALRDSDHIRLGLEASFQSGDTGVATSTGEKVTLGGFGLAGELEWRPQGSKWKWGMKAGTASGDDPTTDAKFEGYIFDRNYDVGMLLFNHPLGQEDFLRTNLVTGSVYDTGTKNINKADVEAISNVQYFAPTAKYMFNDRWSLDNTVVAGFLGTNPLTGGKSAGKSLGYEWDISVNFTPRKGVAWINQLGLLFPGGAFEADNTYRAQFTYGFASKAAISF